MMTVKIKPDKYGAAISLLIKMGSPFQTRFEDMLIVGRDQERALQQAGFVAANGAAAQPRADNGKKAKQPRKVSDGTRGP